MSLIMDGGIEVSETEERLREFINNSESFIHYIGMMIPHRPGVKECITALENRYYKPGTDRNELFIMRIIKFCNILWCIISIPIHEKQLMEEVVKECGLRIADGVPTMIGDGGMVKFPVDNKRVFTLENEKDHPVYRNDPVVNNALLEQERDSISKIQNGER